MTTPSTMSDQSNAVDIPEIKALFTSLLPRVISFFRQEWKNPANIITTKLNHQPVANRLTPAPPHLPLTWSLRMALTKSSSSSMHHHLAEPLKPAGVPSILSQISTTLRCPFMYSFLTLSIRKDPTYILDNTYLSYQPYSDAGSCWLSQIREHIVVLISRLPQRLPLQLDGHPFVLMSPTTLPPFYPTWPNSVDDVKNPLAWKRQWWKCFSLHEFFVISRMSYFFSKGLQFKMSLLLPSVFNSNWCPSQPTLKISMNIKTFARYILEVFVQSTK